MLDLQRTTAADPDFRALTAALDAALREQYADAQDFYDVLNVLGADTPAVVVRLDGEPIACGCFRAHGDGAVELKRMWVAPAHRRGGIAAQVLGAIEAWAAELGHRAVVLETGDRQLPAIALYERHGYARIPAYAPYVGMPLSICMRKPL